MRSFTQTELSRYLKENGSDTLKPLPTDLRAHLPRLSGARGVIFDVYGTLLVSASGEVGSIGQQSAAAFTRAIQAAGLELTDQESAVNLAARLPAAIKKAHRFKKKQGIAFPEIDIMELWSVLLTDMVSRECLKGEIDKAVIEKTALVYEIIQNPVALMPGGQQLLTELKNREIILGIVSNAQFYTPLILETLWQKDLRASGFDPRLIIWSYKEGRAKPDSRLFEKLAQTAGDFYQIRPRELLYVGNDMKNDVFAAASAGFKTALFAGDIRSLRRRVEEPEYTRFSPDLTLTHLSQLPGCLAKV